MTEKTQVGKLQQTTQGSLSKNAYRTIVQVVAQFEPQVAFARKLPNVAESIVKKIKTPFWQTNNTQYLIRKPEIGYIYIFDHQIFYCQTLELGPWKDNLTTHAEIFTSAFQRMDVTRLKSVSFKITTQFDLLMNYAEMVDLVYRGYLSDRSSLKAIHGTLNDVAIQVYGTRNAINTQTHILPQNPEQARLTFLAVGNVEHFVEPKFIDTRLNARINMITADCLAIIVDATVQNKPAADFRDFLDDALLEIDRIVEGTLARVKGLKPSQGEVDGNPQCDD